MLKLKLHLTFFKSTLIVNLTTSFFLAFVLMMVFSISDKTVPFYVLYLYSFMFGGPVFDLFLKEMNRKGEYYFYYNRGISKAKLIISTFTFSIFSGIVFLTILDYAWFA